MNNILAIKDLTIKVNNKIIVSQTNLFLKPGEIRVILGPNGAGKSSLIKAIMGLADYQIFKGTIKFKNKKINKLSLDQRAKLGITMVWQSAPEIKGVNLNQLLKEINHHQPVNYNSAEKKLLARQINVGFSGGEKKISELLQARSLKPALLLIDEIDSGLDIVNLKKVAEIIKKDFIDQRTAILLITHRGEIMKYLQPKLAQVMIGGRIICAEPWQKVWPVIKKFGYQKCRQCL